MSDVLKNTELWDEVFTTDPLAVKAITGKTYKGNSPKPHWLVKRATEVFGAAGHGWGVQVKSEGFTRVSDTDTLHTAVVVVWYMRDGVRCEVEHMGGTKAVYMSKNSGLVVDDDAAKKSVTDGMVKALSLIGFAGDIFTGQWDDSKYQDQAHEITAAREAGIAADKSTAALARAQQAAIALRAAQEAILGEHEVDMCGAGTFNELLDEYKLALNFTASLPDDRTKIIDIFNKQAARFESDFEEFKAKQLAQKQAKDANNGKSE